MSVSTRIFENDSEREQPVDPICPSDQVLLGILQNSDETRSTEWFSHLKTCQVCRGRISDWQLQPRFESLVQAAANYEVEYGKLPAEAAISTLRDVTPGQPGDVTSMYQDVPLRRVGNYDLLALIGSGGSGNVYRARHILLGREVAVKLLLPQFSGSRMARLRFVREMKSIGVLKNLHVVYASDAGEDEQTLYLVMELIVGENADSFASRTGPMPVPDACEIIRQAALGLQHIYENGLVHRDLKPSNLLLSNLAPSQTNVKITDLGLALLIRQTESDHGLTGTSTVLGTTDYMAPEQAEGSHQVDIRADLYSLGCTLYRLLAGRPPFSGPTYDTALKKMVAHASHPIPDIRKWRIDVPPNLKAIVERLMAKDRRDRYATPIELAQVLEPFCGDLNLTRIQDVKPTLSDQARVEQIASKTDPLSSPSKPPTRLGDPGFRYFTLHRWVTIGIIGILLLMVTPSLHQFMQQTEIKREVPDLSVTHAPEHNNDVAGNAGQPAQNPAPAPPPVRPMGNVEKRWRSKFGDNIEELQWPGRRPDGAEVRFSDELQGLVMQSDNVLRLLQLGTLSEGEDVTISVKVKSMGLVSSFGIFTGFKVEDKDFPKSSEFNEASIYINPILKQITAARTRRVTRIESGWVAGSHGPDTYVQDIPQELSQIDLKVILRWNAVPIIYIDSKECTFRVRPFKDPPFTGPFGLSLHSGTLLFQDPQITRSVK